MIEISKEKLKAIFSKKLAKSDGEDIISHTNKVIENIKILCVKFKVNEVDTEVLVRAAILHDIGKLLETFQKYVKTGKKVKFKFTHNIIGWYFVNSYVDVRYREKVANLVLWHHANDNSCSDLPLKISDISNEISDDELQLMKLFCEYYEIETFDFESEDEIMDTEFYRIDNLHRSILITADVCASSGENVLELFESESIDISKLEDSFINSERTRKQLAIILSLVNGSTNIIKAPTGFGKSILGILFAMLQEKSTIWVCPTIVISESIYKDVIQALKMMGLNMTVELYLTGGRVKRSNNNLGEFKSKLIITNIDSFTKPSVSNSFGHRCLMIYDCPVIFDESHDYDKMTCALNASYDSIMKIRHNYLDSTTVNLTATPSPPRFLTQGGKRVNYLPSEDSHYEASHKQKYRVHFHTSTPYSLMTGEFVYFLHVVDEVQEKYKTHQEPKLIAHGRYDDDDKEIKKNLVLDNYGKNCPREPLGTFTNQILTTSCDYSVSKIFIKCPTIQEFFQALGRLNRFGNMGTCDIHVILEKSNADRLHIGGDNENLLQELFIKDLRSKFEFSEFILDELYVFYNEFNNKNAKLINAISKQNLIDSRVMLRNVYPKRSVPSKLEKNVANGNKMRQSPTSEGIYVLMKRKDKDEWITISMNVNKNIGFTKMFDEDDKTLKKQIKVLKKFTNFNKHKKITSEILIKEAIFFDSPYPVFNYEYCDDIGAFKKPKQ